MNIYLVGGAVRDKLLGQVPKDLDYVVTNSTKDEMISLGFLQVGIQFPIFIHPQTKDEYALPRGKTLEEDLFHRDITINSMAMDSEGQIIDPYGGAQDLENKIIRHVSDAFKDDPFRVYRVMRFKARFPNFNIAPETIDLMKEIINTPSFKSISPDRIIKELRVVLSLPKPSLFFEGLKDLKALYCFFPELEKLINVPQSLKYHPEGDAWTHTMLVLDQAASLTDNILVRYSCLVHDLGKGITPIEELPRHIDHEKTGIKLVEELSQRILAPNDWVEAAIVVTKFHLKIHRILEMKASSIIRMFYEMDAFRKPHLIHILSVACQADEMGKLKTFSQESTYLENYFNLVKDVSINDINEGMIGKDIGEAIRQKRINLLKKFKIDNGHQD